MTQILFGAATAPLETDLDANFTELYNRTQALTGASGRVGVNKTPAVGVALDVAGNGVFGQSGGGFDVLDVSSTNSVNMRMSAAGNTTIASLGTTSNHPFFLMTNGVERMRLDTSGDCLIGITSAPASNNPANGVAVLGASASTAVTIGHSSGSSSGSYYETFSYNATIIGSITQSGTTGVAYNTSSDYRLKDNIQPIAGSGAFIDALRPVTWSWKADGTSGAGFIAHELQAVSPSSVTGAKDAVDADGKPIYQAVEYGSSEVIAMLVAEVQALRARVHALGG